MSRDKDLSGYGPPDRYAEDLPLMRRPSQFLEALLTLSTLLMFVTTRQVGQGDSWDFYFTFDDWVGIAKLLLTRQAVYVKVETRLVVRSFEQAVFEDADGLLANP